MEIVAVVAQWVATISVAGGLIYSIRRNGKSRAEQDTQLKTELKSEIEHVKKKLDDPGDGLKAIKKAIDEQALYCARTSTSLKERVSSLEKKPQ